MSPDELAFYRTIWENPKDDAPRLIFADWLDEHGQVEHAEFIRDSIDLYRNPDRHRLGLLVKEYDLPFSKRATCIRGFAHTINCTLHEWNNTFAEVIGHHPIRRLNITDRIPFRAVDNTTELGRTVYWTFGGFGNSSSRLPDGLYDYLWTNVKSAYSFSPHNAVGFKRVGDAYEALGLALLLQARDKLTEEMEEVISPSPGHCELCNGTGFPAGTSERPCPLCSPVPPDPLPEFMW